MKNKKITREQIEYFLGSDNVSKDDLLCELESLANGKYTVQDLKKDVINHWDANKQKGAKMKNKKITIVLENCRDDIARTILIDTKMNMKKYESVNHLEFRKIGSRIKVLEREKRKEENANRS